MSALSKSTLWILISWFAINALQAATTGLMNDETYYWVYSQFPDWGYLDHPPAIMVMIWLGELIGHHPFTTRLLTVVMSTGTLAIVLKLLPGKSIDHKVFVPLYLSLPLLHVFGFITVPDAPLMFFTALFFLALLNFLKRNDWSGALWLLIAVTGMIYAKYHAVLVIGFTLIALPRLLANRKFYLIALGAALLYLPHILWQIQYDYPSVQYHLFDRADVPYEFGFTSGYVLTQLLVLGPVSFWLVIRAAIHFLTRFPAPPRDPHQRFIRVMQVQFWGFLGFFLLMSFRGLVEGNWTAPMAIPAIYLTYTYLVRDASTKLKRVGIYSFLGSLVLVILLRLVVVVPMGEFSYNGQLREFHYNHVWAHEVRDHFGNTPVVFYDGYKHPSVYWYNTGIPSHAESSINYRLTQFDYWPNDTLHWGKRVAWIGDMPKKHKRVIEHSSGEQTAYMIDSAYFSLNTLRVDADLPTTWSSGEPGRFRVTVFNRSEDTVVFPKSYPFYLSASFKQGKSLIDTLKLHRIEKLLWAPGEVKTYNLELNEWPEPGNYLFRLSLQKGHFWPGLNGRAGEIEIVE